MNARDGLSTHWIKRIIFVWDLWRRWRQLVCRFICFFFQFSQFLSVCYCIIMNWTMELIPCVKLEIVWYCVIFLLNFAFQSILIPSSNYRIRAIHTGAKCFVLNRGIEITRCDGMLGLLLPTELCLGLHIKEVHIPVI